MTDHIDNALLRHEEDCLACALRRHGGRLTDVMLPSAVRITHAINTDGFRIHHAGQKPRNKYHREIKPGVWVDVYDVLAAWAVDNPALQHLIKKALQPGERGHKTREQDLADIVASAKRAQELEQ